MKVINQQKNSIIEDLLYSEKVKRTFSAVTQEDSKHPYENGMFISFNNYKFYQEELIKNYKRQYQSILRSLGIKVSREDISKRSMLPTRKTIMDAVVNKIPVLVAACHDNPHPDDNLRIYNHSHFLVYNIHHHLPKTNLELKDAINKMISFLSKRDYVGKTRNNSVDIRPVGTYKHYQDKIAPSDFYEYIQRHTTHPHEENLISYMAKSNKQDIKIRYPFNYIFYSKNVLPEAA